MAARQARRDVSPQIAIDADAVHEHDRWAFAVVAVADRAVRDVDAVFPAELRTDRHGHRSYLHGASNQWLAERPPHAACWGGVRLSARHQIRPHPAPAPRAG